MNTAEHEVQAAAFLDFHERRGGSLEENYELWTASKYLAPWDVAAVRALVDAETLATGERVTTDLDEWTRVTVDRHQSTDYLLP